MSICIVSELELGYHTLISIYLCENKYKTARSSKRLLNSPNYKQDCITNGFF